MQKLSIWINKQNFFYFALILFACSLPLSEFMVSASGGILFLTAWIEDSWHNKIQRLKKRKLLFLIPAIFFVYLLSAVLTRNGDTVLYDLRKALFFIILPLAFIPGKEISSKQKLNLLFIFTGAVLVAVFYALLNWKIFGKVSNLHIHNASLITHIRFSFQLVLTTWFLLLFLYNNFTRIKLNQITGIVVFVLIVLSFLFIQQSLTGITAFLVTILLVLALLIGRLRGKVRIVLFTLIALVIISPIIYIGKIAYPFYFPEKVNPERLPEKTARGNLYRHNLSNKLIENGRYVYLYVCKKEMKEEWNKRSELKYDSLDQYGYSVHSTLVRYLTSKGLKKDAQGVDALSEEDIRNVQNGVSNYLLEKRKWSLFPRIYRSVWEYYVYTKLGYVNNQSLSQRIEFSKAAMYIIKNHFWTGVGTGNWKQAFFDAYKSMDSKLNENYYASSHNQYLNYFVKFGIIGFLLIMFFILYPVIRTKRYRDPLFLIFLVFMFVANFADSNFESHMGSSFFVFYYCFFLVTDGSNYLSVKPK